LQFKHVQVVLLLITLQLIVTVIPFPVSADAPAVATDANVADAGNGAQDAQSNNDALSAIHVI
jgi:hypothetical protein